LIFIEEDILFKVRAWLIYYFSKTVLSKIYFKFSFFILRDI